MLDRNSHEDKIANLIQQTFHESISRKCSLFIYQTFTKKQGQGTMIKFIKTLIKFISEHHTDGKTYVRLVADKLNGMHTTLSKINIQLDYTTEKLKPYI